jgi:thiosulfate/3-mercaptopyruvate sulfurtransferase
VKVLPIGAVTLLAGALAADIPLIQTKDLAARLAGNEAKPAIFQVGPNVLYRSKHIRGALHAGPASKGKGLDALKTAVKKLPRDREVVVYCGCCPWDRCPNINPAIDLLKKMGFTRVKAMYVATNFKSEWISLDRPGVSGGAVVGQASWPVGKDRRCYFFVPSCDMTGGGGALSSPKLATRYSRSASRSFMTVPQPAILSSSLVHAARDSRCE